MLFPEEPSKPTVIVVMLPLACLCVTHKTEPSMSPTCCCWRRWG
jgi:hypothetical protein